MYIVYYTGKQDNYFISTKSHTLTFWKIFILKNVSNSGSELGRDFGPGKKVPAHLY